MANKREKLSAMKPEEADKAKTIMISPHVVVAEDDDAMRQLLASALEKEGYDVIECSNGSTLCSMMTNNYHDNEHHKINLIISDIRMPGFTGLEFLAMVREIHQSIPVIIITAFGDEETHALAHRLGACNIFDKPFDIDHLLNAVRKIIPSEIDNEDIYGERRKHIK